MIVCATFENASKCFFMFCAMDNFHNSRFAIVNSFIMGTVFCAVCLLLLCVADDDVSFMLTMLSSLLSANSKHDHVVVVVFVILFANCILLASLDALLLF